MESITALNNGLIKPGCYPFTSHDHQFRTDNSQPWQNPSKRNHDRQDLLTIEYLASDEMAKCHVFEINEEDASDN